MAQTKRRATVTRVAGRDKVRYTGLQKHQRTWTYGKSPQGKTIVESITPGQIVVVPDLEDGSDRARIIKGHIERGVCVVVD